MGIARTLLFQVYIQGKLANSSAINEFRWNEVDTHNLDRLSAISTSIEAPDGLTRGPGLDPEVSPPAEGRSAGPDAAQEWDPGAGDTGEGGTKPYVPGALDA